MEKIRGYAITGVTTVAQFCTVCKAFNDTNYADITQQNIDGNLNSFGSTILHDDTSLKEDFMYFWEKDADVPKDLKYLTYEEFLNKFVELTIDISGV